MKQKENYLVFAHYHSQGLIRKDILNFLTKGKNYFTEVIFISTKIKKEELKKIPNKIRVIKRKNVGYDFYSFKIGWEYLFRKLDNDYTNKNLYFINSSILFLQPDKILNLIKKIKIKENEFWGISRSRELTDHIQSYCFFFSANLFKNKSILNWWKKVKPLNVHFKVILKYELGLSKIMIKNNIKLMSVYKKNINLKTKNILKKTAQRFNEIFLKTPKYYKKDPTNYFWKDFYSQFGIVKIRLVKDNNEKYNLKELYSILKKKNLLKEALNN